MDPITLGMAGISAAGFITQLIGGSKQTEDAQRAAAVQKNITGLEGQVNDQRRTQMEFEARRGQLEIFRNNQRARAMATNSATNQGAQFGSGLQGGLAQVNAQSGVNSMGIQGNLEIGRNIFGINNQISGQKMNLSDIQSQMAEDQGLSNLGGSLMKAAPQMAQIGGSAYGAIKNMPTGFAGPYV